jgi:hypothetical protein
MRYFFTWYQLFRNSMKTNLATTQGFEYPEWPSRKTESFRNDSDTAI